MEFILTEEPRIELSTGLADVLLVNESSMVSFACSVHAYPPVSDVRWLLDGIELSPANYRTTRGNDDTTTIWIESMSASARMNGTYTCWSSGVDTSTSPLNRSVHLIVQCKTWLHMFCASFVALAAWICAT